jgi:folate-dependent phosphoribosylglycinamide formyltransferase PurN
MIALFAYNFPHKKTQDFLVQLFLSNLPVSVVLAADHVKLSVPQPIVRTKIRHRALLHPEVVSRRLGFSYRAVAHNSTACIDAIRESGATMGVIAGARILKAPVIDALPRGIINFHPGLIPEARGLDAMLWSIHRNLPLGVSAHLIDERVDAGRVLLKRQVEIYGDDSIFDLSERIYETQLEMLPESVRLAESLSHDSLPLVPPDAPHNPKMSPELEMETVRRTSEYLRQHAKENS